MADQISIRALSEEDASCFLELRLQLDRETEFMMVEPGERNPSNAAARDAVQAVLGGGEAVFVAERAGRLVGYVGLKRGGFRRNRHSAEIVIGVLREAWGRHAGTRLLEAAERWAAAAGVHRLELTVMTVNDRAAALYRRLGFEVEGKKRHSMRIRGRFVDEWAMAKLLEPAGSGQP